MNPNPFAALGLYAAPDLTDEQVRSAWQATAAATGPGRPDGGDPGAHAAACAAYTTLRHARGRTEAYAGLIARTVPAVPPAAAVPRPRTRITRTIRVTAARIRHGRPAILGLRLLAGFLIAAVTGHAGAGPAPTAGVLTGLVILLAITARGDLAPLPGR